MVEEVNSVWISLVARGGVGLRHSLCSTDRLSARELGAPMETGQSNIKSRDLISFHEHGKFRICLFDFFFSLCNLCEGEA